MNRNPSDKNGILKRTFLPKMYFESNNSTDNRGGKEGDNNTVTDYINEIKRRGSFEPLFPNENYHYYKQFFEEERLNDKILSEYLN